MIDESVDNLMDEGPLKKGNQPVRRCIVTGDRKPQKEMIRFVVSPDGVVVPDLKAVLPSRGMWVSADAVNLEIAINRNLFAKAAKSRVKIPDDFVKLVESLLVRRCTDWLSKARQAGQAVAGFEKVKSELTAGRGAVVLAASDGADDGRKKIVAVKRTLPVLSVLTSEDLGAAFAREYVVHALIQSGGLATGFLADARRLTGFRQSGPVEEEG